MASLRPSTPAGRLDSAGVEHTVFAHSEPRACLLCILTASENGVEAGGGFNDSVATGPI
jgi:hypothetical protein